MRINIAVPKGHPGLETLVKSMGRTNAKWCTKDCRYEFNLKAESLEMEQLHELASASNLKMVDSNDIPVEPRFTPSMF